MTEPINRFWEGDGRRHVSPINPRPGTLAKTCPRWSIQRQLWLFNARGWSYHTPKGQTMWVIEAYLNAIGKPYNIQKDEYGCYTITLK